MSKSESKSKFMPNLYKYQSLQSCTAAAIESEDLAIKQLVEEPRYELASHYFTLVMDLFIPTVGGAQYSSKQQNNPVVSILAWLTVSV